MARARIPTYEESVRVIADNSSFSRGRGMRNPPNIPSIQDESGAIIATGLGQALNKTIAAFARAAEINDYNKTTIKYTDQIRKLNTEVNEEWIKEDLDPQEYEDRYSRRYKEIEEDIIAGIKYGPVKRAWSQNMKEKRVGLLSNIRQTGWKIAVKRGVDTANLAANAVSEHAMDTGDGNVVTEAAAEISGIFEGLVDAGYVSEEEGKESVLEWKDKMLYGFTLKYIDENPETAYDVLVAHADGHWFDINSQLQQTKLLEYALRMKNATNKGKGINNRAEKVRSAIMKKKAYAQIVKDGQTTLDIPAQIRKELPGDTPEILDQVEAALLEWFRTSSEAYNIYLNNKIIIDMPYGEAVMHLNKYRDSRGNEDIKAKVYDICMRSLANRERALENDSAGTVMAINPKTIDNPDFLIAEQRRLGVPEWNIRLLTNSRAEDFNNNIVNKSITADEVIKELDGLKEKYGRNFHIVVRDLVRQGLPQSISIATILDTKKNKRIKRLMIETYRTPKSELLTAAAGLHNDGIEGIKSDITTELEKDNNLPALRKVIINTYGGSLTGNAVNEIAAFEDALTRTALGLMVGSRMTATSAAKQAVKGIIHDNMIFGKNNNYFIPIGEEITAKQAANAESNYIESLTEDDLLQKYPNGVPKKDIKQELIAIKKSGHFINPPKDRKRLMLVNGEGTIVSNKDGEPFYLTWEEIRNEKSKTNKEGTTFDLW